jgi:hypothetical protein
MTVPTAKVTVLQIGKVKYAFASADDIKKSPLGKSSYLNQILQINDTALKQFSSQAIYEAKLQSDEKRIAQSRERTAQSRERTAQNERESTAIQQEIAALNTANKLRDEIYASIKTLNPSDQKSIESIQAKLAELKKILQNMDKNTETYKILE